MSIFFWDKVSIFVVHNKENITKMKNLLILLIPTVFMFACGGESDDSTTTDQDSTVQVVEEQMEFETLDESKTGIDFYNSITENEDFNFYNYEYIYNGGGVAVGDINNDGLTDIYFTGNQVEDKLYLNKGDMQFEDITSSAFESGFNAGWHTGVNMIDVNGDGWLDLYVCRSGSPEDETLLQNMLFINNQDNTFTEKGAEFGVNVQKRSTHSVFFDYDNDGDLDLYVLNHPVRDETVTKVTMAQLKEIKKFGRDAHVFLENQEGKFVDKTVEAGIEINCYGLGVAASDLDGNGYVDLYVSSDYQDPDFMLMNNGDGTFTNEILERTQHISAFSMGNDMADFNNDGFMDIMSVDMAAEDHVRSKRNMGAMSTQDFWDVVLVGHHYQYMFNGLQMNNGDGTFTEVAQVAGVSKTDWSWAPLFVDFNNDGKKDLFVTNGYRREARDNDYAIKHAIRKEKDEFDDYQEELQLMPTTKIFNYVFENEGDIHFTKRTEDWKIDKPVNSNGAAFADFDNDGDLDLVVNNMEEVSFIMENKLESSNNYVRFKVEGEGMNSGSIGAKVKITLGDEIQYHEIQVSRGYESSVENIVHFGLGQYDKVDEVEVVWPNGQVLRKSDLAVNKLHTLSLKDANGTYKPAPPQKGLFVNVSDSLFDFTHKEVMLNDFESEVLLPNKMSQLGPFISKGDANGDGLEDLYVSGAADFSGVLYIQEPGEGFVEKKGPWNDNVAREEMDSKFVDIDNDGDLDLYVTSGGNEYNYNSPQMLDQLYINDGEGNFENQTKTRLPKMETSAQCIIAADYDGDGDQDLFVGGRQTPGYYPFAPRSYLLENNGTGFFTDITPKAVGPEPAEDELSIMGPGMVTDALFDDIDADGDLDLVVVGEWMPITFFENNEGKFSDVTKQYNPAGDVGWWYSIAAEDFNGDGKNDYIVGNLGANNKFHPSREKPLEIYTHDFDENGTYDIVLAKYQNNICYPVRGRQCSSEQMPFIKEKFPTYSEYATADLNAIYGEDKLGKALHYSATNFHSVILLSGKGAAYNQEELPVYAQLGPVNKSICLDVNKDGHMDVVTVGNNYAAEVETIRYDGGRGAVLLGDGAGGFTQLTPMESGFYEPKDCKDMELISYNDETLLITVSNRSKAKTFLLN